MTISDENKKITDITIPIIGILIVCKKVSGLVDSGVIHAAVIHATAT